MFVLIDCNNFFVSCERIGHPELVGRPVIVLSNNDGCAVALSNEAKALGIKRGAPLFKIQDLVSRYNIAVLSGRHRYYCECSRRVMEALRELDAGLEVYSIDEAFLSIDMRVEDMREYGEYVKQKVWQEAEIPVSVGMAVTRTLAKIASHFAKRHKGYQGVCVMASEAQRLKALELTAIEDVWGIGRRLSRLMRLEGINTALEFASLPRERVRSLVNVTGERTWRELRGESCIDYSDGEAENKSISSTRSFEHEIFSYQELRQAICTFAATIGRKLRAQEGFAVDMEVFVATNRFNLQAPHYSNCACMKLPEPSNFTPCLADVACTLLKKIYRPGYGIKRAGVSVRHILNRYQRQPGLFDDPQAEQKRKRLMQVADALNADGTARVHIAAMGDGLQGLVRAEYQRSELPPDLESAASFRSPH